MAVKIVHLYPEEMNLYGDKGNVICLKKRLEARNYKVDVINVGMGERIPDFDILFIGGGQDKEMSIVRRDVRRKAEELSYYIHLGKTVLAICGGYQLLGEYYKTASSKVIELSGALPFFTEGAKQRMIGNVVFESPFGKIVGFENHSGKTYIANELCPLGRVISGFGNNGEDGTEGVLGFLWQKSEIIVDYPSDKCPNIVKWHIDERNNCVCKIWQLVVIHHQIAACGKTDVFKRFVAGIVCTYTKQNIHIFFIRNIFTLCGFLPMCFNFGKKSLYL